MIRRFVHYFLLCGPLLVGLVSIVQSQGESVTVGDVVEASLAGEPLEYTVEVSEGQILSIRLESDDFDPMIELLDASGEVINSDDDSGGGLNSELTFTVPASGSYTIRVTSINETAEGNFVLRLSEIEVQTLAFDTPISVESDGTESFHFQFEAKAGDVVSIAGTSEEDTDTRLILMNPAGETIAEDDDGGQGINPLIQRALLSEDGAYTLILAPSFVGTNAGTVDVTLTASELLQLTDTPQTVTVGGEKDYDVFELDAEMGNIYRVQATVTSADPAIRIEVKQGDEVLALVTVEDAPVFSFDFVISQNGPVRVFVESYFSFFDESQQVDVSVSTVE